MKYSKYKSTEYRFLPTIPEQWILKSGLAVFEENKVKNKENKENLLLQFSYGTIVRKPVQDADKRDDDIYSKYSIVKKDDIVINGLNLNYDFVSQRVGKVRENGIITSAYIVVRCRYDYSPQYFTYLLKSLDEQKVFHGMGSGIRLTLGYSEFSKMLFPVPPRPEQDQIVRYLDWKVSRINRLIHGYQRQIELLKERRMTIIDNAVTKGIRPDVPMKRIDGNWMGEIPAHWVVVPLKRCAEIRSGITLGKHYNRNETLIERPYLRVANVQNGYVDLSDVATIFVNAQDDMKYRLSKDVVLMTEGGDRDKLGRGCVWSGEVEPCLHQNHIFAVTVNENLLINKYLEYLTISHIGREYFNLTAIKTTNLACTNASKVMAFPIPLPPIDEQQDIINWLDDRLNENQLVMSAVNQKIRLLKEYRTRLISDVVTGQIDVRGEVIPDYTPEADTEDEDAADSEVD